MQTLQILNSKEIKAIKESLTAEFGYALQEDYAYLKNEKDKVFIINKDISKIELDNLKIDRCGLYLAEVKNNQVRLSKEGAQLLVKEAETDKIKIKNIVELNENEIKDYFKGMDLKKELGEASRQIILRYQKETLGCARYKEGIILNFLPKIHRGEVII